MSQDQIPVWLDCDPGHDDAIAILLCSFLPYFRLLGISTVHGNASLENTTTNTISLLTAFEKFDINVYPGAEKPLVRSLHVAESIHGKSGLDGTALLPSPAFTAQPDHSAVDAMAQAISAFPGQISIVCTGTLTNLANLIQKYPHLLPQIKHVSIMGGGIEMGNWTEHAEFNIWCDTEAAEIVFSNAVLAPKTIIVPINVTHTAIATETVLAEIQKGGKNANGERRSLVRQMLYELLTFFADTYKHEFGFKTGPPVHDPLAVVSLLPFYKDIVPEGVIPDLDIQFSRNKVSVIQNGEKEGTTVIGDGDDVNGSMVETSINIESFWKLVYEAVDSLDKQVDPL